MDMTEEGNAVHGHVASGDGYVAAMPYVSLRRGLRPSATGPAHRERGRVQPDLRRRGQLQRAASRYLAAPLKRHFNISGHAGLHLLHGDPQPDAGDGGPGIRRPDSDDDSVHHRLPDQPEVAAVRHHRRRRQELR